MKIDDKAAKEYNGSMIGAIQSSRSRIALADGQVSRPKEIDYSSVNAYFLTSTLITQWPYGEEITNQAQDNKSHKYTGHEQDFEYNLDYMHARYYSPSGEAGMNFMINITSHEVGHGTKALPQYNCGAAPAGSVLHPDPAESGTTMETNQTAQEEGEGIRQFSESDAAQPQQATNEEKKKDEKSNK